MEVNDIILEVFKSQELSDVVGLTLSLDSNGDIISEVEYARGFEISGIFSVSEGKTNVTNTTTSFEDVGYKTRLLQLTKCFNALVKEGAVSQLASEPFKLSLLTDLSPLTEPQTEELLKIETVLRNRLVGSIKAIELTIYREKYSIVIFDNSANKITAFSEGGATPRKIYFEGSGIIGNQALYKEAIDGILNLISYYKPCKFFKSITKLAISEKGSYLVTYENSYGKSGIHSTISRLV